MMDVSTLDRGTAEARVSFANDGTVVDATSDRLVARISLQSRAGCANSAPKNQTDAIARQT